MLHERLDQAGASGYDYRILAVLADLGPLSQADLGRAAALDRRDVTHTVRDLHARELVTRRPDPRDGRQTLVELTTAAARCSNDSTWSSTRSRPRSSPP